jgi:hypothetical protein
MTTEYLDRLAHTSRNFSFLADSDRLLAIDGAAAESLVYTDPNSAIAKARRFTETLVTLLLERADLVVNSNGHARRIEALAQAGAIPAPIKDVFEELRQKGNAAVHGHSGDAAAALAVIEQCFQLGAWWYRLDTGQPVTHTFTVPEPDETERVRTLVAALGRQIDQLRAAFMASAEARIVIRPIPPPERDWRGGAEVTCGSAAYIVHDPVDSLIADDRSWTLMRANAHTMDQESAPVRLCGLVTRAGDTTAARIADGLAHHAVALEGFGDRGRPHLVAQRREPGYFVVVAGRPVGSTWNQTFGAAPEPLDPMVVPLALDALATVADAIKDLHRSGFGHRLLDGDSVVLAAPGHRGTVRDLGLAGLPPLRGEGGCYRAPEQRSLALGRAGCPTDVFQLAALLQHTCTGVVPYAGQAAILRTFIPAFPERLDRLLARALDQDPTQRPDAGAFAAELRRGRRALLRAAIT